jgi:hypothetical protein
MQGWRVTATMTKADWGRLRALAAAIIPPTADLDVAGWRDVQDGIANALADRPVAIVRQFRLFVGIVYFGTWLKTGRSWSSLDGRRREAYLRSFQDSPIRLLRLGFWGLRTMICLGFYGRQSVWASVGYAPVPDGHEVLRGRTTL